MINSTLYVGSLTSPLFIIDNAHLTGISSEIGDDLISGTLSYDVLSIDATNAISFTYEELYDSLNDLLIDSEGSVLLAKKGEYQHYELIPYGMPVWWYYKETLIGKFYSKSNRRDGLYGYKLELVSAIGLLDRLPHAGDVYDGQTFAAVIAGIIPSTISYTLASDVAALPVYGWLPYANGEEKSARTNLQQLLLASGVSIVKASDGNMHFQFLSVPASPPAISDGYVYADGDSVEKGAPATDVEVVEHSFAAFDTDEAVTLYDNSDGSGTSEQQTVVFERAPCHSLAATDNLRIIESGVNYAVVAGMGKLIGKVYSHLQNVVSYKTGATGAKSTASVTEATLVSIVNSANVAQRVGSYYSSARRIKSSFRLGSEKPNDTVTIRNAYNEVDTAIIAKMQLEVSSFIRAKAELITGYSPTGLGNNFAVSRVYTAGTTQITLQKGDRVILIGGGQGGQSGGNGEPGKNGTTSDHGDGGAGGQKGKGGAGGKVFVFTAPASGTYTVTIGVGGAGGVPGSADGAAPVDGSPGGATTITINGVVYSSANGASTAFVRDFINGVNYATPGVDGADGGDGGTPNISGTGKGEDVTYNGTTYTGGAQGAVVYDHIAGVGGGGSGAAEGANGTAGTDGRAYYSSSYGGYVSDGGNGAKGADAIAPEAQTNTDGRGGRGGSGGGGGGGGGMSNTTLGVGDGGAAGKASAGQAGASGRIVVYSAA